MSFKEFILNVDLAATVYYEIIIHSTNSTAFFKAAAA